jgi:hypothetical protein
VIELGIPELESLKREVGFEIMREREREMVEGKGWPGYGSRRKCDQADVRQKKSLPHRVRDNTSRHSQCCLDFLWNCIKVFCILNK